MNQSKYLIPILLIVLILAVLALTIYSTFQVGRLKPSAAIPTSSLSSSTNIPEGAAQYPDQVHITDGIIVFGIIITVIILFDIAWGRRMSFRPPSKSGRK